MTGGAPEHEAGAENAGPSDAAEPRSNGSHDVPAAPSERPSERAAEPREYHTEPVQREAPLAHFEPATKPDTGPAPSKPYVVWSSTPSPVTARVVAAAADAARRSKAERSGGARLAAQMREQAAGRGLDQVEHLFEAVRPAVVRIGHVLGAVCLRGELEEQT